MPCSSEFSDGPFVSKYGSMLEELCNGDKDVLATCQVLDVPIHFIFELYGEWLIVHAEGNFIEFITNNNHLIRYP